METKKVERTTSRKDKHNSHTTEKIINVEGASVKKERSFVRNSYNGQQQQHYNNHNNHNNNNNANNNSNHNNNQNNNYVEKKMTVTRQRSFMRPQSSYSAEQDPDNRNGKGLYRQRSFSYRNGWNADNEQIRDQQQRRRSAIQSTHRTKPAMEIYRPPTTVVRSAMRSPGLYENGDLNYNGKCSQGTGLNINAKEFVCTTSKSALQHSKSSSSVPHQGKINGLQHSKSGGNLLRGASTINDGRHNGLNDAGDSPPRVHFSDDKENNPEHKTVGVPRPVTLVPNGSPIKRSKSLSSADMRHNLDATTPSMPDLGPFSPDIMNNISKTLNDPNSVSARQLMEVVRHIFTRLVEASRYAEPAARLCIAIVEKEKGETFLETLLNSCQEYFQERDRLLRNNQPAPYPGFVAPHPRWIAYMTFLNEMYTQLKRRHVQLMNRRMKNSDTAPGLLLLTLLAQCCHVCLREPAVNSLAETECLFFVLTGVGKDIEVELPHYMSRIMGAARDAFLTSVRVPAVRKTLLQLIEMHAARWQLPAPAVMYYYPGSSSK